MSKSRCAIARRQGYTAQPRAGRSMRRVAEDDFTRRVLCCRRTGHACLLGCARSNKYDFPRQLPADKGKQVRSASHRAISWLQTTRPASPSSPAAKNRRQVSLPFPWVAEILILIARFAQCAGLVWLVGLLLRPLAPRLGLARLLTLHVPGPAAILAATSTPASGRSTKIHIESHCVS